MRLMYASIKLDLNERHVLSFKKAGNEQNKKPHNPNCTRLGFASGEAARFFKFGSEQTVFWNSTAEHLKPSLGGTK